MIKQLNNLKCALLNITDIIEFEYECKRQTKETIDYTKLEQQLSKFCTLVKDFALMNKLKSDVEYFDLFRNPKVFIDLK